MTTFLPVQLLKLTRIFGSVERQISTDQLPSLPPEDWPLTPVFVPVAVLGPFCRKVVYYWKFSPEEGQVRMETSVAEVCWGLLGSSGTFWVTESIEQIEEKLKELESPKAIEPKPSEEKPPVLTQHVEEICATLRVVGHASVPEIIDVLRTRFGGSVTRHHVEEALQNGPFVKADGGGWRLR